MLLFKNREIGKKEGRERGREAGKRGGGEEKREGIQLVRDSWYE